MSKIATDQIEATISKTGDTHPAPRKPEADPCKQCKHCKIDRNGEKNYALGCMECCHFYASQFEQRK